MLDASPDLPDSTFVEDCAVILDELAVLTCPGSPARQPEVERPGAGDCPAVPDGPYGTPGCPGWRGCAADWQNAVCGKLHPHQPCRELPPCLKSSKLHGYRVVPVPVQGSLHLKTACTALDEALLLANPGLDRPHPF